MPTIPVRRNLYAIPHWWRVPKNVTIETTSRCNLRCKYCPSTSPAAPHGDMSLDFYKSIIDRVDFPTIIVPYSNGEPLLHPNILDIMSYTISKGLTTYLTTNGTIWNEDLFRLTLEPNSYYQTIFSLDGLYPSTQEAARPGCSYSHIYENIRRYLDMKLSMRSKTFAAVKISQRGQDWEEIEDFIFTWLNTPGIDFVALGHTLTGENPIGMRRYPCQYSDDVFMMIRYDGTLTLCMYNERIVNGGELPIGKLDFTSDLLEVYNNPAYTSFRDDQRMGLFHPPCDVCPFPFTGSGFTGQIVYRRPAIEDRIIYTHRDYFNEFFSFTRKIRKNTFYGYARKPHAHLADYTSDQVSYSGQDFGR